MTQTQEHNPDVLLYVRESNHTDPIQEQLEELLRYVREDLGYDLDEDVVDAAMRQIPFRKDETSVLLRGGVLVLYETITDSVDERPALRELPSIVRENDIDHIVITEMSSLSGSHRDINNIVQSLTAMHGVDVHFIRDDLVFSRVRNSDTQEMMQRVLSAAARVEGAQIKSRIVHELLEEEGSQRGRPGLGFEFRNGTRVPAENYDEVCHVLQLVQDGLLSKREAADRLGCVRRTIKRALNRPDRYQLNKDSSDD